MAKFAQSMSVNIAETMYEVEGDLADLTQTVENETVRLGNYTKYQEQKYQEILALEELSGYETYLYLSEQQESTCDLCLEKHGHLYSKMELMEIIPPIHPYCQCYLVALSNDLVALFHLNALSSREIEKLLADKGEVDGGIFYLTRSQSYQRMYDLHKVTLTTELMISPESEKIYDNALNTKGYFDETWDKFTDWAENYTEDVIDATLSAAQHFVDSWNRLGTAENAAHYLVLWADCMTLTIPSSTWADITTKWETLLDAPTYFNSFNFFLLGIPEMIEGTFHPQEPLSFQHTMDMLGTLSLFLGGLKYVNKLDGLEFDNRGGIDFSPKKPQNTSGSLLGMAIPDMDDALEKAAKDLGDIDSVGSGTFKNQEFISADLNARPPYWYDTKTFTVMLSEETKFVRVYGGGDSDILGSWIMNYDDIKGLSIEEIVDKYALPSTPTSICTVTVPAGKRVEVSCAGGIFGSSGGGIQYKLIERLSVDCFHNETSIILGDELW
ncbi:MAG: hypothetical protein R3Y07_07700 [Eubacteriales bacterium]